MVLDCIVSRLKNIIDMEYIYINKSYRKGFMEVDFPLPDNCKTGSTLDDYNADAWILLSEEQVEFYRLNSTATPIEVFNMELTPKIVEDSLDTAKQKKIEEANQVDKESDIFFIKIIHGDKDITLPMWLPSALRNTLLNLTFPSNKLAGVDITVLWTETEPPIKLYIPTQWGIDNIPIVELYAIKTLNRLMENLAMINLCTDESQLNVLNLSDNYPDPVVLEMDITGLPGEVKTYYVNVFPLLDYVEA